MAEILSLSKINTICHINYWKLDWKKLSFYLKHSPSSLLSLLLQFYLAILQWSEASNDPNNYGGATGDPILVFQSSESRSRRCLAHHYYCSFLWNQTSPPRTQQNATKWKEEKKPNDTQKGPVRWIAEARRGRNISQVAIFRVSAGSKRERMRRKWVTE